MQVCDAPLTALAVQAGGAHIACGDKAGNITLLEVNAALATIQPGEKAYVIAVRFGWPRRGGCAGPGSPCPRPTLAARPRQMNDREASREKILVARARELMLKERVKSGRAAPSAPAHKAAPVPVADDDPLLMETDQEFWDAVNQAKNGGAKKAAAADTDEGKGEKTDAAAAEAAAGADDDGDDNGDEADPDAE